MPALPEVVSAHIGETSVSARFEGDVKAAPEAALTGFLLPAMWRRQALKIEQPVSARLLEAVPTLQGVFSTWWRHFGRVPVVAEPLSDPPGEPARGVGCFFSGGVDSFFSILRRQEEITHLVFVQGFDMPLDTRLLDQATSAAQGAAAALGKPLIVVRTDLRERAEEHLAPQNWVQYHGGALATIGHLLAHLVGTMLIPASYTYLDLFPWGSHVLTDPLWSSDRVTFIHDGADTTRFEKVQAIAHFPPALDHLRVCWRNPDGAYNCGHCEKCVRTMIGLKVAGTLDQCATLPRQLDHSSVRRMWLEHESQLRFAAANLAGVQAVGDRAMARAIRYAQVRSAVGRALPRGLKPMVKRLARRSQTSGPAGDDRSPEADGPPDSAPADPSRAGTR